MTVENSPKEKENYVLSGILIYTDIRKNTRMHIMHNSRGIIYLGKNSRAQPAHKGLLIIMKHIHREPKKGATLTMAITLSWWICKILSLLQSSIFPTKLILGYPPHPKYVAALPWKT